MIFSIEEIKNRLAPLFKDYGAKSASLFGSYARGEATENSDIDLYVNRGDSKRLRGLGVVGLREDIISVLGKPVDMITYISQDNDDKPFRDNFYRDEVVIYNA